jgi:hypothetical protein
MRPARSSVSTIWYFMMVSDLLGTAHQILAKAT